MPVRDTSLFAYREILKNMPRCCRPIFVAILDKGPIDDKCILEYLRAKEVAKCQPKKRRRRWEISSVSGRRNDLVGLNVVRELGTFTSQSRSRPVHLWRAVGDKREPGRQWQPVPEKELPKQNKNPAEARAHLQEIKRKAVAPVLDKLRASEAGRVLVEYRRGGRRKQMVKTNQGLLFA